MYVLNIKMITIIISKSILNILSFIKYLMLSMNEFNFLFYFLHITFK
jgi:hypothetical protein